MAGGGHDSVSVVCLMQSRVPTHAIYRGKKQAYQVSDMVKVTSRWPWGSKLSHFLHLENVLENVLLLNSTFAVSVSKSALYAFLRQRPSQRMFLPLIHLKEGVVKV